MQEVWAKLVYPNIPDNLNRFEISTYGRLRNANTQYIYKPNVLNSGYYSVRTTLGKRNDKIHILIHKAVAYTFLDNSNNIILKDLVNLGFVLWLDNFPFLIQRFYQLSNAKHGFYLLTNRKLYDIIQTLQTKQHKINGGTKNEACMERTRTRMGML